MGADRLGGREGDLLFEDDVDEGGESGRAHPERRWAEPVDQRGQVRVSPCQDADRFPKGGSVEGGGH